MNKAPNRDIPSIIACIAFIVVGVAAYSVTGDYSPLGSVFPRTISALMAFLSCLYLVLAWKKPSSAPRFEEGSRVRRTAVVVIMLAWAFAMAPVGFLFSSVVAFVLLLVVAHYGSWTPRIALIYAGGAILVMGSLYILFKVVLKVPLPEGMFL